MKFRRPAEAASTGLLSVGLTYVVMSGIFVLVGRQPFARIENFTIIGAGATIVGSIVLLVRKTVGSNHAKRESKQSK